MTTYVIDPDNPLCPSYCLVNKNFCHHPLVRPIAHPPTWRNSKSGRRRICKLHMDRKTGENLVVLSLPNGFVKESGSERAPTPYDMDVLLRLAAMTSIAQREERHQAAFAAGAKKIRAIESDPKQSYRMPHLREIASSEYERALDDARQVGGITLKFRSMRLLLRCLGRYPDSHSNSMSVRDSLKLLSSLRVRFNRWYDVDGHRVRIFEPFIERLVMPKNGQGSIKIRISKEFMETIAKSTGYFVKSPLPLPLSSEVTFNLMLFLPTFSRKPKIPSTCPQYGFQELCERLGIAGDDAWVYRKHIDRALDRANQYFKKEGTTYQIESQGPNVRFVAF